MATINRNSANIAIDQFILGNKAKEFKHQHIADEVCPSCDLENKIIYSPALPVTINTELDTIVRGKNEHEAGHARLTPGNKKPEWSNTKGMLINALEDLRIERGIAKLSSVIEDDLRFLNNHAINRMNNQFRTNGVNCGEVNEAIFGLLMTENGHTPLWQMSDFSKQLFDIAKDDFATWKNTDCDTSAGFYEIEKIADMILEKWEKFMQNNQSNDQSDEQNGKSDEQNGKSDEQNGNSDEQNGNSDEQNGNSDEQNGKSDEQNGKSDEQNGNSDEQNGNSDEQNGNSDEQNGNSDEQSDEKQKVNSKNFKSKNDNLDNHCDEVDINTIIKDEIKNMLDESIESIGTYIPYTDNDEIKKAKNDELSFSESKSKIAGTISMFASYLEQSLRTLSRCRKISGRDKGILDTKYLPAIAKNLTKNVFYSKKQGISLDTTVSILLDESGSMGEEDKFITCRNTAIALAEVLNRLGIKFEILGHHASWGNCYNTNGVHYHRLSRMFINEYKCFDEQYEKVKFRLGNTQHRYGNVDGEALLHIFKRCMNQRSNRHIIFVLSDGEPSGAINEAVNCGHLKTAIDFCRKNGAEVYGFGIKTLCPKRFYGEKYFIHLASDNDFKTSFFRKVADIISKR